MNPFFKQLINQVRVLPESGCWEFLGIRDSYGYGRMFAGNKELKAHRVYYEACEGEIPKGVYLQHHLPAGQCIGHACCNPDHLRISNSPRIAPPSQDKRCSKGHLLTQENTVIENRNGHRKIRCRACRQESWRKNSARRASQGLHT
jgi:hypothetical protein